MRLRVVCGFGVTIASFSPTSRFSSVLLPAFGRPSSRMLGIFSQPGAQVLWLDTPGLHAGSRALDSAMSEQVVTAARDCDVAVLLADPRESFGEDQRALIARLERARTPLLLVASKCDLPGAAAASWPPAGVSTPAERLRVSAQTGLGVDALIAAVIARLPEAPPRFDPEQLSDRPLRFLAAERIREAAFLELAQELPYRLAVEVSEFDESRADLVRIRAELIVERDSQKRITVGSGGEVVKKIGSAARLEIEALLGTRVYLELRVRVEPRWSRNPARVKALGYD
jgi:GTP-binding protein Era